MIRNAMLSSMPKNAWFVSNHSQIRTPSSLCMITRVITKNALHVMDVERVYKEKNSVWKMTGESARNVNEFTRTNLVTVFLVVYTVKMYTRGLSLNTGLFR